VEELTDYAANYDPPNIYDRAIRWVKVAQELARRLAEAEAVAAQADRSLGELIRKRDEYHDLLDDFVDALGGWEAHGEHSNLCCPWFSAKEYARQLHEAAEAANNRSGSETQPKEAPRD